MNVSTPPSVVRVPEPSPIKLPKYKVKWMVLRGAQGQTVMAVTPGDYQKIGLILRELVRWMVQAQRKFDIEAGRIKAPTQ